MNWILGQDYDHAYAIVRVDDWLLQEPLQQPVHESIQIQKVVWDSDEADAEAARLNNVNKDKECTYIVQLAHVKRRQE